MNIYSQKIAAKLMLRGFVLLGMGKNSKKEGKNTFFFKNSDELKNALKEIINEK